MQHDLDPNEPVRMAAEWIASTPRDQIEGALVPAIRRRFPISIAEAIQAMKHAETIRRGRAI